MAAGSNNNPPKEVFVFREINKGQSRKGGGASRGGGRVAGRVTSTKNPTRNNGGARKGGKRPHSTQQKYGGPDTSPSRGQNQDDSSVPALANSESAPHLTGTSKDQQRPQSPSTLPSLLSPFMGTPIISMNGTADSNTRTPNKKQSRSSSSKHKSSGANKSSSQRSPIQSHGNSSSKKRSNKTGRTRGGGGGGVSEEEAAAVVAYSPYSYPPFALSNSTQPEGSTGKVATTVQEDQVLHNFALRTWYILKALFPEPSPPLAEAMQSPLTMRELPFPVVHSIVVHCAQYSRVFWDILEEKDVDLQSFQSSLSRIELITKLLHLLGSSLPNSLLASVKPVNVCFGLDATSTHKLVQSMLEAVNFTVASSFPPVPLPRSHAPSSHSKAAKKGSPSSSSPSNQPFMPPHPSDGINTALSLIAAEKGVQTSFEDKIKGIASAGDKQKASKLQQLAAITHAANPAVSARVRLRAPAVVGKDPANTAKLFETKRNLLLYADLLRENEDMLDEQKRAKARMERLQKEDEKVREVIRESKREAAAAAAKLQQKEAVKKRRRDMAAEKARADLAAHKTEVVAKKKEKQQEKLKKVKEKVAVVSRIAKAEAKFKEYYDQRVREKEAAAILQAHEDELTDLWVEFAEASVKPKRKNETEEEYRARPKERRKVPANRMYTIMRRLVVNTIHTAARQGEQNIKDRKLLKEKQRLWEEQERARLAREAEEAKEQARLQEIAKAEEARLESLRLQREEEDRKRQEEEARIEEMRQAKEAKRERARQRRKQQEQKEQDERDRIEAKLRRKEERQRRKEEKEQAKLAASLARMEMRKFEPTEVGATTKIVKWIKVGSKKEGYKKMLKVFDHPVDDYGNPLPDKSKKGKRSKKKKGKGEEAQADGQAGETAMSDSSALTSSTYPNEQSVAPTKLAEAANAAANDSLTHSRPQSGSKLPFPAAVKGHASVALAYSHREPSDKEPSVSRHENGGGKGDGDGGGGGGGGEDSFAHEEAEDDEEFRRTREMALTLGALPPDGRRPNTIENNKLYDGSVLSSGRPGSSVNPLSKPSSPAKRARATGGSAGLS
mmetsp:Transcript_4684/g.9030  ORF Transcript_4684/g.9030 Transcript_4684/m.9030 type:complete len:1068 (+) Transcript_4684:71-3274(+)